MYDDVCSISVVLTPWLQTLGNYTIWTLDRVKVLLKNNMRLQMIEALYLCTVKYQLSHDEVSAYFYDILVKNSIKRAYLFIPLSIPFSFSFDNISNGRMERDFFSLALKSNQPRLSS